LYQMHWKRRGAFGRTQTVEITTEFSHENRAATRGLRSQPPPILPPKIKQMPLGPLLNSQD
jgi:hypothetical protein